LMKELSRKGKPSRKKTEPSQGPLERRPELKEVGHAGSMRSPHRPARSAVDAPTIVVARAAT
jgi:hypothetical protein